MNLKYRKVSLVEIIYKKKIDFFTIFIFFLDVPVYVINSINIFYFIQINLE